MEEIENPMVVDVQFEQGTFADVMRDFDRHLLVEDMLHHFDDCLRGPAFVPQYPSRRTTDVRVSPRYL